MATAISSPPTARPDWIGCRDMEGIEELLARNERFAYSMADQHLEAAPSLRVAVVACMDARLDVFNALGLGEGEAHVIRNAGGVISDDVLRSLAISQRKLGTREVMLLHHTRCGMEGLDEAAFEAELEADVGSSPPFAIQAFDDVEADLRDSILRLRGSALLPHRDAVRGFVYDVDSHRLREVTAD